MRLRVSARVCMCLRVSGCVCVCVCVCVSLRVSACLCVSLRVSACVYSYKDTLIETSEGTSEKYAVVRLFI